MSGTLNKVMLIGHTGDEVKMHYFEGGNCIGRFPLATNDSYVNKSTGERVVSTEWHNIVVRNKAAEICEKYLKKGDKIYIEGRLKTRKWQDEQGKDRYSTEIQCTDFTFLTPKNESGQPGGSMPGMQPQQPAATENPSTSSVENTNAEDDDLPF
ncbi:single-stranded DNA-binding protein [Aquimarina hainanensis]|uniref:Single-stranded DNA-binding protein n=1 Tax=Aquimarina hainanensis TaxID=1578017 RepID=A0ABW5N1C8_9FLAO|nr:single-stranded DNA-binding protein [Aquimarina sp. TRL1]QKX04485.1 single-stranded DNA-binding protein [Aquimarina sp. TRL1]